METLFEKAFVKALRKHSGTKKQVENKVRMIMEQPLAAALAEQRGPGAAVRADVAAASHPAAHVGRPRRPRAG